MGEYGILRGVFVYNTLKYFLCENHSVTLLAFK